MKDQITRLEKRDKHKRTFGASLLCIAALCIVIGDKINKQIVTRIGMIVAIISIIIYFSDRIEKLFRK